MVLVVTHNGAFHADDVLAVSIVEQMFSSVTLVRTREPEWISSADVVIDVGGKYEPRTRRFDHHQVQHYSELARENGVPYASAGLVWKEIGQEAVKRMLWALGIEAPQTSRAEELYAAIRDLVDEWLIQPVDAADVGYVDRNDKPVLHLNQLVMNFNPAWNEKTDDPEKDDLLAYRQFYEAVRFMTGILHRTVKRAYTVLAAARCVQNGTSFWDGRVLKLDYGCPWQQELRKPEYARVLFVIYPDGPNWRVQCVPPGRNPYEKRLPLPADWAGKRSVRLAEVSSVPDATFCHPGRFTCGAETLTGAIALAWAALSVGGYVNGEPGPKRLLATFRPQRWNNDLAENLPEAVTFDATRNFLELSNDQIRAFETNGYDSGHLVDGLPERERHDGPFEVDVDIPSWLEANGLPDAWQKLTDVEIDQLRSRYVG